MLSPSYQPIIGGTEKVVRDLTNRLNFKGIRTDVMTFNMDKKWEPKWRWETQLQDGHLIYRVPAANPLRISRFAGPLLMLHVFPSPTALKEMDGYDILHMHDAVDLTFPLACCRLRKPKIFHCHTFSEAFSSYRRNPLTRELLMKIADAYVAPSRGTKELLFQLGISSEKIHVIPNGVDEDVYRPDESQRSGSLIVFVGRFDERKGLVTLLDSLKHIKSHVTLVIIGPSYDDEYSQMVLRKIAEANRTQRTIYLGVLSESDILQWLQRATLLVCPSSSESFGIVCVEAIACATPVVASDIGGLNDIIINQENGLLVKSGDTVELAEAIQFLLDNPRTSRRLGKQGRIVFERRFTLSAVTDAFSKLYVEMSKLRKAV